MILSVCRRILGNATDADDAFQATFLVLVRKVRSIDRPELLGNWLYGVAYRVAHKARAQSAKRSQQKPPQVALTSADPLHEVAMRELQAQVDEELERLPARYRAPLVLCYLEGLSNREAAQRLGWPVGSISHRLTRGRELLRQRLQARHPNASYLVLGVLPIFAVAAPDLAETLVHLHHLVMRSSMLLAHNDTAASVVISPAVQQLSDNTLKEMAATRRTRVALIVVCVLVALSAAALAGWSIVGAAFAAAPASAPAPAGGCHSE